MKRTSFLMLMLAFVLAASAQTEFTRGIGKYPGRPSENFAPNLVPDNSYRNLALNRAATASSSVDYNLTAQLATDGIVSTTTPVTLEVRTPEGILSLRDKEKTFDGNIHSANILRGGKTFISYSWTGKDVLADEVIVQASLAYYPNRATKGYAINIQASDDGMSWKTIGSLKGNSLPGEATQQMVSSDPNKAEARERLPLREINIPISIPKSAYSRLRVEFIMPGAAYWKLTKVQFNNSGKEQRVLPAEYFSSAWLADGSKAQWLAIDLGREASVDEVRIHWLHRPLFGEVQTSDDGRNWRKAAILSVGKELTENIPLNVSTRFVRLYLRRPDNSNLFALTEVEVMGRGGIVAQPQERRAFTSGNYSLNGGDWTLRREGYDVEIPATVPATVLASYENAGALPQLVFGNNLRQASESFFCSDFHYKTHFTVPETYRGRQVYLNFDGINWKAEIFLNKHHVGWIRGAFECGRFNVTSLLAEGNNLLEIRILRNDNFGAVKTKTELNTDLNGGVLGADNPTFHASVGWDWITSTPGRELGIWNDVFLSADGGVSLADPLLVSRIDRASGLATIKPSVIVRNNFATSVDALVRGRVGQIHFEQSVTLPAQSEQEVTFNPADFPQLCNQNLHLWWPNGYGEPYLYDAGYSVSIPELSDSIDYKAGIRQIDYEDVSTALKIYVNHRRFIPMGGNWGFSETNLNYRAREYDAAVKYHRDMNFNMIRNWVGQIGDKEFYDACDKYGLMVWQDFWLANPWDGPDPTDETMFMTNAYDYVRRIRRHPCLGIYVGRNEGYPPQTLNTALENLVAKEHPDLGYIPSSADDGVSGHGPYWLMPTEWYFKNQTGKLHSERGVPNPMVFESLLRSIPNDELWPIGLPWAQHDFTQSGAQRGKEFLKLFEERFGRPLGATNFSALAQWLNYDSHRAMYESMLQNRMGLLMWMSHPAWPSMVWQTYDYYLLPTAAFYGIKKACEPLHLQWNPATDSVQLVNTSAGMHRVLAIAYEYDMYGKEIVSLGQNVETDNDQTQNLFELPEIREPVSFLRLVLTLDDGKSTRENFYVRTRTPKDFRRLELLRHIRLDLREDYVREGDTFSGKVTLTNNTNTPALFIRLDLRAADGEQILPVSYSDNYFSLMPGESREVSITFRAEDTHSNNPQPHLRVSGFNVR